VAANVPLRSRLMRAIALATLLAPVALLAQQPQPPTQPPRPPREKAPPPTQQTVDSAALVLPRGLKARSIGPATMGGRVSSLAFDPKDPWTFYVGLATGGIMKTADNGGTFTPIFEHETVAAIGDVAVAPSDPQVVWAGTGEANDRNTVSWGAGVYRSTDGGGTWTRVGLESTRAIARVVVHPTDPGTAWVCAPGDVWQPGERGIYKTTDGGKTWKKTYTAPAPFETRAGCGDLAIDPSEPNTLYAAVYARRRRPWQFDYGVGATDGKDVGGILKSTDGGATWTKLTNGLPAQTGRIGLTVYRKNPKVVYAVVQSDAGGLSDINDPYSKAGGVFRTDDAGATWTRMSKLDPRPFYFSQIRVDPENDKKVYVLGFMLHVSEDGGKTWREDRFKNVHSDNHALAIDPRTPQRMLLGTDGGVYETYDGGAGWQHLDRFAGGEFFRVSTDGSTPYRICGGLQDNTNWVGPSDTRSKEGIRNADWRAIGGGDGSYCAFDALDSNLVYAESQQGYLFRIDLRSGQTKDLHPQPTEGQPAFRFHWTSPLVRSAHTKGTMYYAGNRVFRLTEHGERWQLISPDLSTRSYDRMITTGSGAEDYGVVYALAESPAKAGVLWAGTDEGKLWRTEDDGGTWTDLSAALPVKTGRVASIALGAKDPSVAYVAIDAHRDGDYAPHLLRTADGGRTWTSVAGNLPNNGPVKVVREDPRNPDVLFAGTEFGLWATLDRGRSWFALGDLPTVAVDDIHLQPATRDLIAATHGRSLYVIDDVTPLEELTPAVRAEALHLFTPRPVVGAVALPGFADSNGGAVFRGENPPTGAVLTWWARGFGTDPVKIAVTNAAGQPVANLTGAVTPGINRVTWDLMMTKDLLTEYGGEGSKPVAPGEYTVTITQGKAKSTGKLTVGYVPGVETR
jgi:photosystem II stability/assembly factor-like uncharacterized protein